MKSTANLILLLLTCCLFIGCKQKVSSSVLIKKVCRYDSFPSLKVQKIIGNTDPYFAVFASLEKSDFDLFKKSNSEFTTWNTLDSDVSIDLGKTELITGTDLQGEYSCGKYEGGGLRKIIVWDKRSNTIVFIIASGML